MEAVADVPDDLAGLPVGVGLAAVLHGLSLDAVPNDRMLDVLGAQYRQLCHEQARMAATLVELARCDGVPRPGAVSRSRTPVEFAEHETRAALRWTRADAAAEHELSEAALAVPELFAAWDAGLIDRQRVSVFQRYLNGLDEEKVAAVCAVAVPRAPKLTGGQLAALLRRLVIEVDPDAAARWYRRGVRERTVRAYLTENGTVTVTASGLPPDEAEAACARLEALAGRVKRAGHSGRIGQIRSDLYLGLLDGRFHYRTDDEIVAAMLAAPRRPEDSADDPGDPGDGPDSDGPGGGSGGRPPDPPPPGPGPPPQREAPPQEQERTDPRVGIEVRANLGTLLGHDERPGEIPGLGPILAAQVRARVAVQARARWRFAVVDAGGRLLSEGYLRCRPAGASRDGPAGGIVEVQVAERALDRVAADPASSGAWASVVAEIATKHARYGSVAVDLDTRPGDRFPSAALRRHTEIRDRTCTFAGVCRRPAHRSPQDHGRAKAAGGPTIRSNVGPVCTLDHILKHRAGWTSRRPGEPGTVVWESPLGGRYTATGEFLTDPLIDPPARPG